LICRGRNGWPIYVLLPVLFLWTCTGPAFAGGSAETFDEALVSIYAGRDEVISGSDLLELMDADLIGENVYLLDIRSVEEWNVSRLADAEYVGYEEFSLEAVAHIPREAEIILYCAVGWRSGRVAAPMREAGYRNVRDLYGGILLWSDEGHPLVDDRGRTQRVHGSMRRWGRWVQNPDVEVVY
jgi:rhodanese-related sulfurtransferase